MNGKEVVTQLTSLMRSSKESFWTCLRRLLVKKGINLSTTLLVFSVEQGENSEFGVVITEDRRVFSFALATALATIETWNDVVDFIEWDDITLSWKTSPYRGDIEAGFELVPKV